MAADNPVSATVDANGNGICQLSNNYASLLWELRQVACFTRQPAPNGTVSLWKNGILWAPAVAMSPIPNLNNLTGPDAAGVTASGLPYMTLRTGDTVQAVFMGCTVGDIVTANFILEEFHVEQYGVTIAGG